SLTVTVTAVPAATHTPSAAATRKSRGLTPRGRLAGGRAAWLWGEVIARAAISSRRARAVSECRYGDMGCSPDRSRRVVPGGLCLVIWAGAGTVPPPGRGAHGGWRSGCASFDANRR